MLDAPLTARQNEIIANIRRGLPVNPFNAQVLALPIDHWTLGHLLKTTEFSDKIISAACDKYRKSPSVPNQADYFITLCRTECAKHRIEPNEFWHNQLVQAYLIAGITDVPKWVSGAIAAERANRELIAAKYPKSDREVNEHQSIQNKSPQFKKWEQKDGGAYTRAEAFAQVERIMSNTKALDNLAKLMGMEEARMYRDRVCANLLNGITRKPFENHKSPFKRETPGNLNYDE